jgi:biotin operon repressor
MTAIEESILNGHRAREKGCRLRRLEVWDVLQSKERSCESIARHFGISASTVKRYIDEIERYGYTPRTRPRQGRGLYVWDRDAVDYFKAVLLAAIRETGACTVRNAYRETKRKAQEMGWHIGSEPSAYVHAGI